ncbi:MAG: hypothetical protein ACYTGO_09170, partial [Planctomycetota bacterium]
QPEEEAMPVANLRGICTSCDRAEKCGFTQTTGQLFLRCNEHEGFQGLYLATNGQKPMEAEPDLHLISGREAVTAAAAGHHAGLCVNCDNRHECGFPKPPAGVWHCDEYQ